MKQINVDTTNQASQDEKDGYSAFEQIVSQAKENFLQDEGLESVVFVGLKAEEGIGVCVIPAGEFMQNTQSKEALSRLMIQIGKKEPLFISLVTEAWISMKGLKGLTKEQALEKYQAMPPSQDPDREEIIMCSFESENIQKMISFKILRNPVSLEPFKEADEANRYEGRFANILKDMKKIKYN